MENEENRGLINKKTSEDQLASLVWTSFGGVFFYFLSLSYSWTLRVFLEHSWRSVVYLELWSKKAKEEQESTRGHRDQQLQ